MWRNMTGIADIIGDSKIIDKNGNTVNLASHCNGKIVGLYFRLHYIFHVFQLIK